MCGAALTGFTELEALEHQNACLDASLASITPPPLPALTWEDVEVNTNDTEEAGYNEKT